MKRPLCTICLLIAAAIAARVLLTMPGTPAAAQGRTEMPRDLAAAQGGTEVPETSAAAQGGTEVSEASTAAGGTGEMPEALTAAQGGTEMPEVSAATAGTGEMPEVLTAAEGADSASENTALRYVPEPLRDTVMRGERVRVSGQVYQCRIYEDQIVLWLQNIAVSGEGSGTVRTGESVKEMCICYCEKGTVPQIGSVVLAEGTPDAFSSARNPGEFDSARYYWTQGAAFRLKNAELLSVSQSRTPVRAALFSMRQSACALLFSYLPEREAGVLCAMLLGDKTSLDEEVRDLYSQSGIAHVLAISGLHISLLGLLLKRLLRRTGAPLTASMAVCGIFLFGYGMMTGMSASTLRALVMFFLGFHAERVRRTYDLKTAFAVSMVLQLFRNPRLAAASAFQLSFGAVAGIAWVSPVLEKFCTDCLPWKKNRLPKPVRAVVSCLAVSLATMPILLAHQYEYAVYGFLFNLLVLPSVSVLLPAGFLLLFAAMAADGCAAGAQFLAKAGAVSEGTVGGMLLTAAEHVLTFARILANASARAAAGCCKLILSLYERGSRIVSGLPGNLLRGRPQNIRLVLYAAMLVGLVIWAGLRAGNACGRKRVKEGIGAEDRRKTKGRRAVNAGGGRDVEGRRAVNADGGQDVKGRRAVNGDGGQDVKGRCAVNAGGGQDVEGRRAVNAGGGRDMERYRARMRAFLGMGWLVLALLVLLVPVRRGLRITMLDVGQGDGICIEQRPGHAVLVDCGSSDQWKLSENRLLPFLKYRGIYELDAVFISHLDNDHVSAVYDLLETADAEHLKVGQIVLGAEIPQDAAYEKLLAAAKEARVPVHFMRVGEVYADGVCRLTCLGPSDETGRTGDRNTCSLILRLDYGEFQALFMGDADARAELAAVRTMAALMTAQSAADTIELLKVAHHGSRYSTSEEFLELVSPRIGLISAGENNSYGHPHEETLARLDAYGCDGYLTAESGAVTIYVDRKGMRVETFWEK